MLLDLFKMVQVMQDPKQNISYVRSLSIQLILCFNNEYSRKIWLLIK